MTEAINDSDDALQLFLNGFTARDLAEPLPSFDDTTSLGLIREAMHVRKLEVIGLRQSGFIVGWMSPEEVAKASEPLIVRTFEGQSVISDTVSVNQVVRGLNEAPCLFVRSLGQVCGFIRRSHLHKPAMRMWLFGLVTISELRVTRMIDEYCPRDAWQKYLSPGRMQKAHELQHERRRRGQHPSLVDCLQFADKGQIVARDEALRRQTRFATKREVENFVKALQDLRNNLAHAQDLTGDWDVIYDLTTNLHRIVLGPVKETSP